MKQRRKEDLLIKHRTLKGWLICSQTVIAILLTVIYPLVMSLYMSFTDIKLNLDSYNFVWFDNFAWVFRSSGFLRSLGISVLFSVVSTLLQTVLGFFVAVMLYFLTRKLQSIFKTIIYLPVVLPGAVVSAMWLIIYAGDEFGLLNILFHLTDPPYQWMSESDVVAFLLLVLTNTWRYLGITMVVYFVNMNAVSKDIIESASLDGANKFQIMWKIIFPLTWGATVINLLMSMIGGVKSFDLFFLFQTNGTLSQSLTPVSVLIYRVGIGNTYVANISLARSVTMSIILSVILGTATVLINKLLDRKEAPM